MSDNQHDYPDPSDLPNSQIPSEADLEISSDESNRRSRRLFFKAGLAAAPVVLTLRNRAAWGQGQGPPAAKPSGGIESNFYGSVDGTGPGGPNAGGNGNGNGPPDDVPPDGGNGNGPGGGNNGNGGGNSGRYFSTFDEDLDQSTYDDYGYDQADWWSSE